MSYMKMLRELFARECSANITIDQAVEFLELNGFYKDIDDGETARKILSAHKKQEARRFLSRITDNSGQRLYANFKSDSRHFCTNVNEAPSERLLKAESALYDHIKGARKHYRNVQGKRKKAQSAERNIE